ncbi:aldo/keto reductase [Neorhizobium galegae]|uniref:aldo/keto reductase n=1 Tax=Neorhizobium galegae TaxID=399 RepID=UPI0006211812|nr:aldo/keto reductase [Neorhizobium galegae]MCQ1781466.1 aldo/keto reductase [Neorhizobium galegae]MCQ1797348.1 aldo/keto reductase [Neorhizobium galegae]CDZ30168.1 Aldo/keto reductase [Neorhizobium galegae bv. officinalis]
MNQSKINRRSFLGTLGATATGLALAAGATALAQETNAVSPASESSPDVVTRSLPRTGERVTALGLGTFLTFDLKPGDRRDALRQVFERYVAAGGRVVDTSPLYGSAEVSVGQFMGEFERSDEMFLANKVWSTGEYLGDESHAVESFRQSRMRTWRDTVNLMQCHSITNAPVVIPLMKAWKKEGLIRHVGVTHHESAAQDQLLAIVQRDDVDFIQTNYSIFNRDAERRLLPAAADKGVGVLINLPLEKARLMKVVEGHPLPGFAQEFGATSWAQFFLKWVMAHPAVSTVLCGTSNPDHMSDNVQAMTGPLPDERMRARMVAHMETIPGFGSIGTMPWYPGKEKMYSGLIREAQENAAQRLQ